MSAQATAWVLASAPTETPDQQLLAICLSEWAGAGDPIGDTLWAVSWPGWHRIRQFCRMPDLEYLRGVLSELEALRVVRWDGAQYLLGESEMAGRP